MVGPLRKDGVVVEPDPGEHGEKGRCVFCFFQGPKGRTCMLDSFLFFEGGFQSYLNGHHVFLLVLVLGGVANPVPNPAPR